MKNKKKYLIFILVVLVALIGFSFGYYVKSLSGTKKYILMSNNLRVFLDESKTLTDNVIVTGAIPVSDTVGKQNDGYLFSIVNEEDFAIGYTIYLDETEENTMPIYAMRYNLLQEESNVDIIGNVEALGEAGNRALYTTTLKGKSTHNYTLTFWLGLQAENDAKNETYSARIRIETTQQAEYVDGSGANVPELTSGMIPVKYDETEGGWVKADTSKKWYNYDEQWWANAVTVTEESRSKYMGLAAGEPISMDDINTMWVWIPRYEYFYVDMGTMYAGGTQALPGEIIVEFITSDQIEPSHSRFYKIPEGFKFGEENIPGFWMAKFETSTKETCTATTNSVGTACDLLTLTPQVIPNVTSWRGARISTFFEASRLMQSSDDSLTYNADTYGFDTVGSGTMDVHMLKNTEWGIVAMLSQSKYGKYGNINYSGSNKKMYSNKSSAYITGMSTSSTNEEVSYDTPDTGYGASTTGTIYGVYDMSGGAYEYVMGNYNNFLGISGFCTIDTTTNGTCREWPDSKYYDLYESNIASSAYKAGDATYETFGWYGVNSNFINSSNVWFERDADYIDNSLSSAFNIDFDFGQSNARTSSHFAIKP